MSSDDALLSISRHQSTGCPLNALAVRNSALVLGFWLYCELQFHRRSDHLVLILALKKEMLLLVLASCSPVWYCGTQPVPVTVQRQGNKSKVSPDASLSDKERRFGSVPSLNGATARTPSNPIQATKRKRPAKQANESRQATRRRRPHRGTVSC